MPDEGKETSFPSQFGRYTLVERLATGGMAEVFKAKIQSTHGFEKLLVIKRILPNLAADKTFVSMFIDEAKLTAQLIHPKIVQVTDFGEEHGQYFIALEFVEGFDGLALLRAAAKKQVRLPVPICMYIAMEVLDALDYAHNAKDIDGREMHLVHRDISPSNVFIARRGDVKLGDFGIAHAQERESKTQAGTLKGKYGYMSPEQVAGGELDGRSDIFAVGVVLAELLMCKRLFTAPNDLDVLLMVRDARLERWDKNSQHIPAALDTIVRKSLAKQLDERFQTAVEFRHALDDLQFQLGLRVGPSDLGTLAADLFDTKPEAMARLEEQSRKWRIASAAGSSPSIASLAARATPHRGSPVSQSTRVLRDDAGFVDVDLGVEPAAEGPGSAAATVVVTALDNALSNSMALVELDQYSTPSAGAPALSPRAGEAGVVLDMPGTPFETPIPPSSARTFAGGSSGGARPGVPPSGERPGAALPNPDSAGDLSLISTMRVFADLAITADSGLLRFDNGAQLKDVYLTRGAPESVNSNLPADRFGEYLVTRGFLRMSDLERALAELPRFSGKLGEALVGLGFMRPLDVFRLLSQQVRERVMALFTWTEGEFAFYRGIRNPMEAFPLGLNSFEILGAGVLALNFEFLQSRFLSLMDFRPRGLPNPRINPEAFRLGPTPREVWNLLDGSRSLAEWVERFGSSDELLTFYRTLHLLVETSLAQFE